MSGGTRSVMLLGATGLVGRELLSLLLEEEGVARVVTLVRRPGGVAHARLDEHVVDLSRLAAHAELFRVDQIFCALGTTIRKAGSREEFRRVDYDLPLQGAKLGREGGARHFLLVSAIGADAQSRIFYNRVKGEVEKDLRAVRYPSLTIARPSLLLGARAERRLGEELAKPFGWLMPSRYKPIEAHDVALALVRASRSDAPGVRILESREMRTRSGDRT
jgi:uncharacterized protein YbjT (DUF2867 family)